jgi:hypothetical protein
METGSYRNSLSRARINKCCLIFPRVLFVDIQIQEAASNFKININERKPNGSFKRVTRPLEKEIAAGRCIKRVFQKTVNPCEKNFWSIGLQGSLFNANAENGWVFKDKDCTAYEISELPIADPEMRPSAIPTVSPSLSGKPSARPTTNPTLSTKPSANPSISPTLSAKPSTRPTANPTLSTRPSAAPIGKGKGMGKGKSIKSPSKGRVLYNDSRAGIKRGGKRSGF